MKRYIACNEVIHIDVKREDETFTTIYEKLRNISRNRMGE